MGLKEGGLRGSLRNIGTGVSVIPDSAIWRTIRDEGSGTTAADSIGSADLSLNGPSWVADANAQGGFKLSYDGSDDDATATIPIASEPEILLCFTIETTSTSDNVLGWDEDGGFGLVGVTTQYAGTSGALNWRVGNGSSLVEVDTSTLIDDGSKYRIGCALDENNEIYIAVNSSIENSAGFGTKGPVSDTYIEGRNPTAAQDYFQGNIDDAILYTDVTQATLDDDYALQPWS